MRYIFIQGTIVNGEYIYTPPNSIVGEFEITLGDISFQKFASTVYVACSLCSPSFLNNEILPILRRVDSKKTVFTQLYFHRIFTNNISQIRLQFLNKNLQSIEDTTFMLTLCLRML